MVCLEATVRIPCASRTIPVHDLNESDALFHHASSGKQLSAERPRDVVFQSVKIANG